MGEIQAVFIAVFTPGPNLSGRSRIYAISGKNRRFRASRRGRAGSDRHRSCCLIGMEFDFANALSSGARNTYIEFSAR